MAVIGTFARIKNGYVGTIRTLTINAKVRIVANDRKVNASAPEFRLLHGATEIGAAWKATTKDEEPRNYLSAVIDDPLLPEPLRLALFEEHGKLNLVWRRWG